MINLPRKIFCFFLFYVLTCQNILAFPGWQEEAIFKTKHPRLVTLDDLGKSNPELIPKEVYIDREYQHKVESKLSKRFFGIYSTLAPPTFVVEMSGEKTYLEKDGLVLIDRGNDKKDVIREFVLRWEYYNLGGMFQRVDELKSPEKFDGKVASIATKYSEGYYHFLFDMLPRLRLLQKSGLAYDKLYVSGMHPSYVKEALEMARIEGSRVISSNDHPIISADQLVLPSFPGISYQSTPWVIKWIQDFYLEKDREVNPPKDLIYISRSDAARRRITNEEELLGMLKILGFKVATFEGKSVKEQALIFQNAKVIMGPHGAAFSNIIFAQKGATLLELMNPSWPHGPFAVLAKDIGLKYGYVFGQSIDEPDVEDDKKVRDYTVSLKKTWKKLRSLASFSSTARRKVRKYLKGLKKK